MSDTKLVITDINCNETEAHYQITLRFLHQAAEQAFTENIEAEDSRILLNYEPVKGSILNWGARNEPNLLEVIIPAEYFLKDKTNTFILTAGFTSPNGMTLPAHCFFSFHLAPENNSIVRVKRCLRIHPDQLSKEELCSLTLASLTATDALGRSFEGMWGRRKNKNVGIFYLMWLGQHPDLFPDIYDNSKLLKEAPDALWNISGASGETPENAFHFWGQPLLGYYNCADPWVLHKHVQQLTFAGVEFLGVDLTNGSTYDAVWQTLMPIIEHYMAQGWNAPKICFYTNSSAKETVLHLYKALYQKSFCKNAWHLVSGKPLIIVPKEVVSELPREIQDFFAFRFVQWPSLPMLKGGFPWIDWRFPPEDYEGTVCVSAAQHCNPPFSNSLFYRGQSEAMDNANWGKGYDFKTRRNTPEDAIKGTNFESQWQWALNHDPETIFVTGWNEWVAQKLKSAQAGKAQFVDCINEEFNRDIEPEDGPFGDNFYLQFMRNARTYLYDYQGSVVSNTKTIDPEKGIADWHDAGRVYVNFTGACEKRDFLGAAHSVHYTDRSKRNSISKLRVVNDKDFLYILVETAEAVRFPETGTNWMNIFMGVSGENKPNWEGFHWVANRFPSRNFKETSLEYANGKNYDFQKLESIPMKIEDNTLFLKIPLDSLGIKQNENFTLRLKAADNVTEPQNILSYYKTGDSAPTGRLSYDYHAGAKQFDE